MFKWLKKFLKQLEEENKAAFNGKKLDCCTLNNSNQTKHGQTQAKR